jgi:hypothetical protein
MGMMTGPAEFDLNAAWLRRANGDMKAFMQALAVRLEDALPGRVEVERKRDGFFSRESHAVRIAVAFDSCLYTLLLEHGQLHGRRAKIVHGVTLSSDDITVPDWFAALNREVGIIGQEAGDAHSVIHDFLMS